MRRRPHWLHRVRGSRIPLSIIPFGLMMPAAVAPMPNAAASPADPVITKSLAAIVGVVAADAAGDAVAVVVVVVVVVMVDALVETATAAALVEPAISSWSGE